LPSPYPATTPRTRRTVSYETGSFVVDRIAKFGENDSHNDLAIFRNFELQICRAVVDAVRPFLHTPKKRIYYAKK